MSFVSPWLVGGIARRTTLLRTILCSHFAFGILNAGPAAAQTPPAPTVVAIDVQQEGETVNDPLVLGLLQTRTGDPAVDRATFANPSRISSA